jgi:hypothetical protein
LDIIAKPPAVSAALAGAVHAAAFDEYLMAEFTVTMNLL